MRKPLGHHRNIAVDNENDHHHLGPQCRTADDHVLVFFHLLTTLVDPCGSGAGLDAWHIKASGVKEARMLTIEGVVEDCGWWNGRPVSCI